MRREWRVLFAAIGLVALVITAVSCSDSTISATAGVSASVNAIASTTSSAAPAADETGTTSPAPTRTPTTAAGGTLFPELVSRYSTLLGVVHMPDIRPYSLLSAAEVASVFVSQTSIVDTKVQGYRLANGDTVVIYEKPYVASDEAFALAYGGEGREVFARSYPYTDYGYLVASKDYAENLGLMVDLANNIYSLDAAITEVEQPDWGQKPYN
jgi:hypothetical protein